MEQIDSAIGKTIKEIWLDSQNGGILEISFTDGTTLKFCAEYTNEWSTTHDATIIVSNE